MTTTAVLAGRVCDRPSLSMKIDATTNRWPVGDSAGTSTATNTASYLANDSNSILDSVEVTATDGTARTITIAEHDGTTVIRTIVIAASQVCPIVIPIGGPGGAGPFVGLAAKVSNTACVARMNFRRGY